MGFKAEARGICRVQDGVKKDCTLAQSRELLGTLYPKNEGQIQRLVQLALKHKEKLYPFSTGKNWGYGSGLPVLPASWVVDLSGMQKIKVDAATGLATLEPGVTQRMLHQFLHKQDLPYLCPTTGGGPHVSILGNALERGFGLTPYTDHFYALSNLRAVLANGELYTSALSRRGFECIAKSHKWGIGPYMEGAFAQGNLGIVTRACVRLRKRSVERGAFVLKVSPQRMEQALQFSQHCLHDLEGVVTGINLMNPARTQGMSRAQAKKQQWTLLGRYAGVSGTRCLLRRYFKSCRLTPYVIPYSWTQCVEKYRPWLEKMPWGKEMAMLLKGFAILEGVPNDVAAPLVYQYQQYNPKLPMDVERDQLGLMWCAPLMPWDAKLILKLTHKVETILMRYRFSPMITLTALQPTEVCATIPIVFDKRTHAETAAACYEDILNVLMQHKCFPYRMPISQMSLLQDAGTRHCPLYHPLKQAIDPEDLLAGGRYE
ncbi:MAG: FAD-dependent oxidoreductase [Zetaproteobacteria bacterium]|nr:FAD-dependent oxidoreductase [Zetaproteobacteria bacterium]